MSVMESPWHSLSTLCSTLYFSHVVSSVLLGNHYKAEDRRGLLDKLFKEEYTAGYISFYFKEKEVFRPQMDDCDWCAHSSVPQTFHCVL